MFLFEFNNRVTFSSESSAIDNCWIGFFGITKKCFGAYSQKIKIFLII